jgi:hypothetical protein
MVNYVGVIMDTDYSDINWKRRNHTEPTKEGTILRVSKSSRRNSAKRKATVIKNTNRCKLTK